MKKQHTQYALTFLIITLAIISLILIRVYTPTGNATLTPTCSDTDGGVKRITLGTISGSTSQGSFTHTDTCIDDKTLLEYYCADTVPSSKPITCNEGAACKNGACVTLPLPPSPQKRPNIILILTDDLDQTSMAYLPRFKSLLQDQGTTFTSFYVTNSLCCPSRASILRGQYPHNHHVLSLGLPDGGFDKFVMEGDEQSTVATWLQNSGYRTALIGKYLNKYPGEQVYTPTYVPVGWDEWAAFANNGKYYNYTLNQNGNVVFYGDGESNYSTYVLTTKAEEFIRTSNDQPFFLYLAPKAPHGEASEDGVAVPPLKYRTTDRSTPLVISPAFNEKDINDKPQWVQQIQPLSSADLAELTTKFQARIGSAHAEEDMVEQLIAILEETGKLDNTYIIFTSDNGFHLGEHRLRSGKGTAYEEDVHVPLIVRGPGVPEGKSVDNFILNHDLAPTIADLAGIQAPSFVDGKSFKQVIQGNYTQSADYWRRRILLECSENNFTTGTPAVAQMPAVKAVRTHYDVYMEYENGEKEYYVLQNGAPLKNITSPQLDPYQLTNQVNNPKYASRVSALQHWLSQLKNCKSQECLAAEGANKP